MSGFPLLLIPLAICNIVAFLMRDVTLDAQLFSVPMVSGASWAVTFGDALLALGVFLLLLEILKSARPGGKYVTDHVLSLMIFGGAATEFVMLRQFANSTFFLLTLIALVDFLGGLGLRARRPRRVRETVAAEPIANAPFEDAGPLPAPPVVATPLSVPAILPETAATPSVERPLPIVQPARVEPIIEMGPPDELGDKPRPVGPLRDGP